MTKEMTRRLAAQKAGRAWAEREADALIGPLPAEWLGTDIDALPLIESTYDADAGFRVSVSERRILAAICNTYAAERWAEIISEGPRAE